MSEANIPESAKHTRSQFILYLTFTLYCLLIIASTSDVNLILNGGTTVLPLISAEVPLISVFLLGPFALTSLFLIFQLHLYRLCKMASKEPEPDKLFPFMLLHSFFNPEKGLVGFIQSFLAQFTAFYSLPISLLIFQVSLLKKHSVQLNIFALLAFIAAIFLAYFFQDKVLDLTTRKLRKFYHLSFALLILVAASIQLVLIPLSFRSPAEIPLNSLISKLLYANLEGLERNGLALPKAHLEGVNLESAKLNKANFQAASFKGANLKDASLNDAELQNTNFADADLKNAQLNASNFYDNKSKTGANFQNAQLTGASLNKANLHKANFEGAYLEYASLQGANLSGANFKKAFLQGSKLIGADINEADFRNTQVSTCQLCSAEPFVIDLLQLEESTKNELLKLGEQKCNSIRENCKKNNNCCEGAL